MNKPKVNNILAMSSGGPRVPFMEGFIKGMCIKGNDYTNWNTVLGISAGALLGSYVAQFENNDTLNKGMDNIMKMHVDIMKPWVILGDIVNLVVAFVWHDSIFKPNLRHMVNSVWEDKKYKHVYVGTYCVTDGKYESFPDPTKDQIVASASIPVVFPPVTIDNKQYVDGAMAHIIPIEEIKQLWNGGTLDVMLCYPTEHAAFIKATNAESHYKLSGRVFATLNENTWYNMNRDLDDLADFAGVPKEQIRKSGAYQTKKGLLRMFIPKESIYVDLSSKNHAIVVNMQEHGKQVAREVLEMKPINFINNK